MKYYVNQNFVIIRCVIGHILITHPLIVAHGYNRLISEATMINHVRLKNLGRRRYWVQSRLEKFETTSLGTKSSRETWDDTKPLPRNSR